MSSTQIFDYRIPIEGTDGQSRYIVTNDPVLVETARAFGQATRITDIKGRAQVESPTEDDTHTRIAELQNAVKHLTARVTTLEELVKNPRASARVSNLRDIREEDLKVEQIWDDQVDTKSEGRKPKWNIRFVDSARLKLRIGTFDPEVAKEVKAAYRNNEPIRVKFGRNPSNFLDIVSVRRAA